MAQSCTEAKDQAAVISILFHTRQLTDEHGPPPAFLPLPGPKAKGP